MLRKGGFLYPLEHYIMLEIDYIIHTFVMRQIFLCRWSIVFRLLIIMPSPLFIFQVKHQEDLLLGPVNMNDG